MYIDVLHDAQGKIEGCHVFHALAAEGARWPIGYNDKPVGTSQTIINIDTVIAMEIEVLTLPRAEIDPATGKPVIIKKSASEVVLEMFEVDMAGVEQAPASVRDRIPAGVQIRKLRRKA